MPNTMIKFLFDLDGTLTQQETLPYIAKHFHIQSSIEEMTKECVLGKTPFEESFTKRVAMLKHLPVDEIAYLLEKIPLFTKLDSFIKENKENCALVTSNLHAWVKKLCDRIGCDVFSSTASIQNNQVTKITHILKKEDIVKTYQKQGYYVVFIGDGNNDLKAMECANLAIAVGLLHKPPNSLLNIADYSFYSEENLYEFLHQILLKKH